ncbi:hypothetical protein KBD81_01645 [Candidatus Woesebacteria bacterium]|nr:hypothetical protein [Candidatus Woesebacteria bacterium]
MKLRSYQDVKKFLEKHIPAKDDRSDGVHKFERALRFMELLGDPQNKVRVIHIAGTSGKGSTAQCISHILTAHGFKTGLTISPHIRDVRERTQINDKKISAVKYREYLNEMVPYILKMDESTYGPLTFFEITMAHAYYSFWREKVEYAIVETGMGGRLDASNTATGPDKMCVLTKIGLDHQEFLGNTIAAIASEKAGIIHKGNTVLSLPQSREVTQVFKEVAGRKGASLIAADAPQSLIMTSAFTQYDFSYKACDIRALQISLHGLFQAENTSLAIATACELGQRDGFAVDEIVVRNVVKSIHIPGRFQIISHGEHDIIIDGAHNPQKMEAFISSLKTLYPLEKFDFVLAFKKGKDFVQMLQASIPLAAHIYVTEFAVNNQGLILSSVPVEDIATNLDLVGYNSYTINTDAKQAFASATSLSKRRIVITGSMYLVSELYGELKKRE